MEIKRKYLREIDSIIVWEWENVYGLVSWRFPITTNTVLDLLKVTYSANTPIYRSETRGGFTANLSHDECVEAKVTPANITSLAFYTRTSKTISSLSYYKLPLTYLWK